MILLLALLQDGLVIWRRPSFLLGVQLAYAWAVSARIKTETGSPYGVSLTTITASTYHYERGYRAIDALSWGMTRQSGWN